MISLAVKTRMPAGGAVRVEPLAGIVLVRGDASAQTTATGATSVLRREKVDLHWNPGLLFGADVRIGGGRVAVVPGVRFAFTNVPKGERCEIGVAGAPACSPGRAPYLTGFYPRWTQRPSVALAVRF